MLPSAKENLQAYLVNTSPRIGVSFPLINLTNLESIGSMYLIALPLFNSPPFRQSVLSALISDRTCDH